MEAGGVHPFRTAWETRDLAAWRAALAPGVVAHSPMLKASFEGPEVVAELYGVLFDAFGEVEITNEFENGADSAFFWRTELGGTRLEGTDLIRLDGEGRVAEMTIMMRPLVGIAEFAAAAGPPLAAKRGPLPGLLARLIGLPLRLVMRSIDAVASRLVVLRR